MPEHLKALAVILSLSGFVFVFAKAPACAQVMAEADFKRRRNLWLAVTLTAFLAGNYWLYAIVAGALVAWFGTRRDPNPPALFFFLLFAVPPFAAVVPGLGLVNYLLELDYLRLLALVLLLPAWLALRHRQDGDGFGRCAADGWLTAYLLLLFLLQWNVDTLTNSLRYGVYGFLGAFLPYYVTRRLLRDEAALREAAMAFVVAGLVLALCALFEFAKRWLLYGSLPAALGQYWSMGRYLARGSSLRAMASTGHPIAMGYVMMVALGLLFYLRGALSARAWSAALALLLAGLLVPLSRGPWVGTLTLFAVLAATDRALWQRLAIPALLALLALPLVFLTPLSEKVIAYLPFVGSVDADTVTYRQHLLDVSLEVIGTQPWFGSADYLTTPAMQTLMQGEQIVDLVNSYLGITLSSGVVGLFLFVAFFLSVMIGIRRGMARLSAAEQERYRLGQALLAILAGILVTIFTVSGISVIPIVYWSLAGMGAAYAAMLAESRAGHGAPDHAVGRAAAWARARS